MRKGRGRHNNNQRGRNEVKIIKQCLIRSSTRTPHLTAETRRCLLKLLPWKMLPQPSWQDLPTEEEKKRRQEPDRWFGP